MTTFESNILQWEQNAQEDPYYSILTEKGKKNLWKESNFFQTGERIEDELKLLEKKNIKVNFNRALDFGCGVGRLSIYLKKHFKIVDGVDCSGTMIELAKKCSGNINFILNTSTDLKILESKYDFILSMLVLQHIHQDDSKKYIKEFCRLLDKDGVLWIQIPDNAGDSREWRGAMYSMYGIPKEEVTELLITNGVDIIEIVEDGLAGNPWTSYTYIGRKNGS